MWWAAWCAVLVAGGAGAAAAPAPDSFDNLAPFDLVQIDSPAPDDEGVSYAVPAMAGRYAAGSPLLYMLAEMPRDPQVTSSDAAMRQRRWEVTLNPALKTLADIARIKAQQQLVEAQRKLAEINRAYIDARTKRDSMV